MRMAMSVVVLSVFVSSSDAQSLTDGQKNDLIALRRQLVDLLARIDAIENMGKAQKPTSSIIATSYESAVKLSLTSGKPLIIYVDAIRGETPQNCIVFNDSASHWIGWGGKNAKFVVVAVPFNGEMLGESIDNWTDAAVIESAITRLREKLKQSIAPSPSSSKAPVAQQIMMRSPPIRMSGSC
jgi:hypothetical protein